MLTLKRALIVLWLLMLGGCATLHQNFEKPTVTVTSFRAMPSNGMAPRFVIGLHVINPNRFDLPLKGMTYNVSLEGRKLLNGVANNLSTVPAYGEADIDVYATADLIGGFRLLADLLHTQKQSLTYQLKGRLDLGSLYPYVNIDESGEVKLDQGLQP